MIFSSLPSVNHRPFNEIMFEKKYVMIKVGKRSHHESCINGEVIRNWCLIPILLLLKKVQVATCETSELFVIQVNWSKNTLIQSTRCKWALCVRQSERINLTVIIKWFENYHTHATMSQENGNFLKYMLLDLKEIWLASILSLNYHWDCSDAWKLHFCWCHPGNTLAQRSDKLLN